MFKSIMLAGAAALASVSAQECQPMDFTTKSADFGTLNSLIEVAASSGLLTSFIPDPVEVKDKKIDGIDFSLLGLDFTATPTIDELTIDGISGIAPRTLDVMTANELTLGTNFTTTLTVNLHLTVTIKQNNKPALCLTDPSFDFSNCKPSTIPMTVDFSVVKPEASLDVIANVNECASSATDCEAFDVNDLLNGALAGDFDSLLGNILYRTKSASIDKLDFDFEKIEELAFHFDKSLNFAKKLSELLYNLSEDLVNKKGLYYKIAMPIAEKAGKSILNDVLSKVEFGNSCGAYSA